MATRKTITVFCGSADGRDGVYREATAALAHEMARRSIDLVYGGGNRGLMGFLADALRREGRHVTGVLPRQMDRPWVRTAEVESELIITDGMHERKARMYDLGEGFIALPGGIGTLEELAEVFTWQELGYLKKPLALLNVNGYWDSLLLLLSHMEKEGFLNQTYLDSLIVETDPKILLDRMERNRRVSLPDKLVIS